MTPVPAEVVVSVLGALVQPYKTTATKEPWDWDGTVPGWLTDSVETLARFYPEAERWSQILDLVAEHAPTLLESYVPPDPFVRVLVGGRAVFADSAIDYDTLEPRWSAAYLISSSIEVEVWDADLAFHDLIATISIPLASARGAYGAGAVQSRDLGPVWQFDWSVSAP